MQRVFASMLVAASLMFSQAAFAQITPQVVDIPTRPGVTQRFIYLAPADAQKIVVLFTGGLGNLQIAPDGSFQSGRGNFLVRSRQLFADQGLAVAVVDAPSDRQSYPFLDRFRQTPEHAADIKGVIAWLRQFNLPVWLVGTSRGTQSAAYIATQLPVADGGPDGLVLTSTILTDPKGNPVPALPLEKLTIPVLVVHHEQDGCRLCDYRDMPRLMDKLAAGRKELITLTGGISRGDPCEAFAYHGFNGLENDAVAKIAVWIKAH
ncbi:MAG: hypothetical protein JWQ21_80 [Herminiimonas sp.]|nr:hypothetical protein [Herminiimonas sp.]